MPRIPPFFLYYGAKWRAAPLYPQPVYKTIIEPFAGAAGYSMNYPDRDVYLIDKNPIIVGLWDYLIHVSEAEVLSLPLMGPYDSVDDLDVCQEAASLIGFWLNNGVDHPCRVYSKRNVERMLGMLGMWSGHSCWSDVIRSRVAENLKHIRHWRCTEGDYWSLEPISPSVTWFVDPPYANLAGKHYPYSDVDYRELAAWCESIEGQVIVCENEGATWLPFEFLAEIHADGSAKGHVRSNEAIWIKDAGIVWPEECEEAVTMRPGSRPMFFPE